MEILAEDLDKGGGGQAVPLILTHNQLFSGKRNEDSVLICSHPIAATSGVSKIEMIMVRGGGKRDLSRL